jgi:hypothetical protein
VPAAQRDAHIERRLTEFKARSYEEQLTSFGFLRRDLERLLGSDEAAVEVIRERFKPYLKSSRPKPPPVRPARLPVATRPPDRRPAPQPPLTPSDDPATAILQLVRRRPGQLSQTECLWVLRGLPTDSLQRRGLTRDPQFGSCARRAGALRAAADRLRERGAIEKTPDGKLHISGRRSP